MVPAIILTIMVAALSLYDFLSSKNWQEVTSSERNDIVFEERNHAYGAYQIRKNYSSRMILIMVGVILTIGLAFGIYKIIQSLPKPEEVETPLDLTQFAVDAKEKEEDIVEPLEPEIPEVQKSIQFLEPKVTNDQVDTPPPVQNEMENTAASTVNSNGNSDFGGTEVIIPKKEEPIEVKKEPEIFTVVDEPAEYPGGLQEARKYLAENINYPDIAREMGYQGKCHLKFVVSENGYISNVTVLKGVPDCPECDKEAVRVVKSMKQWKPAKINGKAVNSYYTLPVNFKLG